MNDALMASPVSRWMLGRIRLAVMALMILWGTSVWAQTPGRFIATNDLSGNLVGFGTANQSPPILIRNPMGRIVATGDIGVLSLNVLGTPPLNIRWYFNQGSTPIGTNESLVITNFGVSQVGGYYAIAGNAYGSVTSAVARLELDANNDGLSDAWQLANFGSLTNQNAYTDSDSDGVSNLDEWQDQTNPKQTADLRPRLSLTAFHGTIEVTPNRVSYASNELATLRALPDAGYSFVGWLGDLLGSTNPVSIRLTRNSSIQAVFGIPLDQALSTTNVVSMGGDGGWYGENVVSPNSAVAAKVGIPFVQGTTPTKPWLETQVTLQRDGIASFWWKMDGFAVDELHLVVDGYNLFPAAWTLTSQTAWQKKIIYLAAGTHEIRWEYTRGSLSSELSAKSRPEGTAYVQSFLVQEYANPLLDSNGDGLADLWEYKYFDKLAVDPNGDLDTDGVSNATEFADGTNPTEHYSVIPRVTLSVEGSGRADLLALTNRFRSGDTITNAATPGSGWGFVGWVGPFHSDYGTLTFVTNNPVTDRLNISKSYTAVFGLPLGSVLGLPGNTWTTGGLVPWYGQTNDTHHGVATAHSGRILWASGETWLETSVTGPGTLSFWWKVDSNTNRDTLALLVNGAEQPGAISGTTDWQVQNVLLSSGAQVLRWRFKAQAYETNVTHTAWLSEVVFTGGSRMPQFDQALGNLVVYEGHDVSITTSAAGTPPITYQLMHNNVLYGTAGTNTVLTISSITPALAGTWKVRAVNVAGQVDSAPFQIQVIPIPANDLFANRTVLTGTTIHRAGYTIGATPENGENSHSGWSPKHSVWYRWTAPSTGNFRMSLTASNYTDGIVLGIYTGTSVDSLVLEADESAYGHETNGVSTAFVTMEFATTIGTEYEIVVDDTSDAGMDYVLDLNLVPPPSNDNFANSIVVRGSGLSGSGSLAGTTLETGEPSPFVFIQILTASAWWTWIPNVSGMAMLTHTDDGFSPMFTVYTGNNISTLTMVANMFTNTNPNGLAFPVVAGQSYPIQVGTMDQTGNYTLNITALQAPTLNFGILPGNTNVSLSMQVEPRKNYEIEASVDLYYWWPESTVYSDQNGVIQLVEPFQERRHLFYRARLIP